MTEKWSADTDNSRKLDQTTVRPTRTRHNYDEDLPTGVKCLRTIDLSASLMGRPRVATMTLPR